MSVRVLIVDDSSFFQRQIAKMLAADKEFEVVGTALNGAEAVEKAASVRPDVITMDVEMPVMDGIAATRKIMATHPVPILMFSSLTVAGAKSTLSALDAGAVDFIPKRFEEIARNLDEAGKVLRDRLRAIAKKGAYKRPAAAATPIAARAPAPRTATPARTAGASERPSAVAATGKVAHSGKYHVVAIGTSTGGPVALQNVLSKIPADFPLPILLIQHMPGTFTPAFAERLNQISAIKVKEAVTGDILFPGVAYLAPGGKQMLVSMRGDNVVIRVEDGDPALLYKPSVDVAFSSIADVFPGRVLTIVLTGMGADGREGARKLKQAGSTVWAQDEASCVVYGMPAAIVNGGLADRVFPLGEVGDAIVAAV